MSNTKHTEGPWIIRALRASNCDSEAEDIVMELLEFLTNARTLAMSGPLGKDELYAELRGDFCKRLLAKAEGR